MYTGHASINNGYAVLSTGITNIKNISRSVTTFVNIQIGTKFCCLYLYWYTPYIQWSCQYSFSQVIHIECKMAFLCSQGIFVNFGEVAAGVSPRA